MTGLYVVQWPFDVSEPLDLAWDDYLAGPPDEEQSAAEPGSPRPDWAPVDLAEALLGQEPLQPTVMRRDDGLAMFYPGKHHLVYGETESGKSWLAQAAAAEQLRRAKQVLYVDFESDERSVVDRLVALGVRRDFIAECLHYVNPAGPPVDGAARQHFAALLRQRYALVVLDGVTEGMGLFGLSPRDEADVAHFYQQLPNALASRTGAAVVSIDHVSLNKETRGRFALGSQHKLSGLTGAAYLLDEVRQPFGRGQHGVVSVCVAKDRPGYIRGRAGAMRSNRTQVFAEFHLISPDAAVGGASCVKAELRSLEPAAMQAAAVLDRPSWYMEQISLLLEAAEPDVAWTATAIARAIKGQRASVGKHFARNACRAALKLLLDEGYVAADTSRQAHRHTSLRPYRQDEQP